MHLRLGERPALVLRIRPQEWKGAVYYDSVFCIADLCIQF